MNGMDRQNRNPQSLGQAGYNPPPAGYQPPPAQYNQAGQYPPVELNPYSYRPYQPPGKSKAGLWIGIVVGLMVIIGVVVAAVVIFGGKATNPAVSGVAGTANNTAKPANGSARPAPAVPASLAATASKYPAFNKALTGLNELGNYPGAEKITNKVFSREIEAKAEGTLVDIDATGTEFFITQDEATMVAFYLTSDPGQKVVDYYTNIFKSRNYFRADPKQDSFGIIRFSGTDRALYPAYDIAVYPDTFQFAKDVVGDAQKVKGKSFFELRVTYYLLQN